MSTMTDKGSPSRGMGDEAHKSTPKKGEHFRCQQCGMEMQITNDCKCTDPDHVRFQCCGEEMRKK